MKLKDIYLVVKSDKTPLAICNIKHVNFISGIFFVCGGMYVKM